MDDMLKSIVDEIDEEIIKELLELIKVQLEFDGDLEEKSKKSVSDRVSDILIPGA